MRAIVQERYGPPEEVLELREIDRPTIGNDEVLVSVRATSAHPDVWHAITGRPYILRLFGAGVLRPKDPVPGMDVAGRVEGVGKDVTRFELGDAVFGATRIELEWRNGGAFAEYAAVHQDALARKPVGVSFDQAATVPTSGFIALLNLRSGAWIERGQSVLINGAGGGVGSIAVQLAKAWGAIVTGVDSGEKLGMVRDLGADHVVDYTREDFTRKGERYDLIFDVASNLSLADCRRALKPEGTHVLIGHDHFGAGAGRVLGSVPRVLGYLALSPLLSQLKSPDRGAPTPSFGEALGALAELLEAGRITPVIDRTYPLEGVTEAMRHLQEGRARGRIVITPQHLAGTAPSNYNRARRSSSMKHMGNLG
jgi:NADPH:quinone reductase-like Zn-dependent oxidoreductase